MRSPRYHREIPQRYRLEGEKCTECGKIHFPPRVVCSNCRSQSFETITLSGEGKIKTFTIIRIAPDKFSLEAPYAVGIIELKEGINITAQITDCNFDDLAIDKEVKLVFRLIQNEGKSGLHCYGYKAILV